MRPAADRCTRPRIAIVTVDGTRAVGAIQIVGVVGAGTMGAGIAQVALEAGNEVVLYDVDEAARDRGRARIGEGLTRRAMKLQLDTASTDDWVAGRLERLRDATTLEAVADGCDLVVEAALEDLALKRSIFRALDAAARPHSPLATNTSALSVAAIAAETGHPERVLGLHFFNPAPLMPLVEVVVAPRTSTAVAASAGSWVRSIGKTPVRCADSPGFIVNRVNRPFTIEALRLLESRTASVELIDAALTDAGYPMGPFGLMDFIGIDVNLAAATSLYEALGRPERLRPSPIQERLLAEGRLGRKTGAGFYEYDAAGRIARVSPEFAEAPDASALAQEAIADRIVLAVANEAFHAIGDRVAWPREIDQALQLGAGHPHGPIAWAQARGLGLVTDALDSLRRTESDRFAPATALREAAAGGR